MRADTTWVVMRGLGRSRADSIGIVAGSGDRDQGLYRESSLSVTPPRGDWRYPLNRVEYGKRTLVSSPTSLAACRS